MNSWPLPGWGEDCPDAVALADMLFDTNAGTFRKGRIDSWNKEFTPELRPMHGVCCERAL